MVVVVVVVVTRHIAACLNKNYVISLFRIHFLMRIF